MKFELEPPQNRNVPDNVLIQDVVEVAQRLGQCTLTLQQYEKYGKFHPSTLQRRFRSWFKVLEKADLKDSGTRLGMEDDEFLNNIKEVWIALGRQPRHAEMKPPLSKYWASTYNRRFGTWRKALEAFVKYINEDGNEESSHAVVGSRQLRSALAGNHHRPTQRTRREISERLRFSILLRDGFRCHSCGRSPITSPGIELHVDHIKPWSNGGETFSENLQTKCKECNLGKGNAFDK